MRLGDLDALKEAFAEYGEKAKFTQGACQRLIDNATTVEGEILTEEAYSDLCLRASRERPQGEWVQKQVTPASCIYVCSECGTEEVILTNFCCWCGADMRKGGAE